MVCFALSFLMLALAQAANQAPENPTACLTAVDFDIDYFPDKVFPQHSQLWEVEYHKTYKVVTNNNFPDQKYLLYLCGSEIPAGVDETLAIPIPLQATGGYSITTTSSLSHMELMEVDTAAKGYITSPEWISSNCFKDKIEAGDVTTVPGVYSGEEIPNSLKDVVAFLNPGSSYSVNLTYPVFVNAYLEKTNLAIGEWHKFFSVFFNTEKKANEDFDGMEQRYECVSHNAQSLSADGTKKKVIFGRWSTWSKAWSFGACPNYYCDWVTNCGGEYVPNEAGNLDDAAFVEFAKDADILLWSDHGSSFFNETYADKKEVLDQLKAVQNEMVFDSTKDGLNTWYEHRLVEFDVVLEDVCSIISGTGFPHQREFFRNVFTEEVGSVGECEEGKPSFTLKADECVKIGEEPESSSAFRTMTSIFSIGVLLCSLVA
ncbi:MAG: hypothetical protein SGBAC_002266 [Bacillariaceae sp.]